MCLLREDRVHVKKINHLKWKKKMENVWFISFCNMCVYLVRGFGSQRDPFICDVYSCVVGL